MLAALLMGQGARAHDPAVAAAAGGSGDPISAISADGHTPQAASGRSAMIIPAVVLALVVFLATIGPTTVEAQTSIPSATRRFDQTGYAVGGCANLMLDAPRLSGIGAGLRPIEVAAARNNRRAAAVTIPVHEDPPHSGRFRTTACVRLATSGSRM